MACTLAWADGTPVVPTRLDSGLVTVLLTGTTFTCRECPLALERCCCAHSRYQKVRPAPCTCRTAILTDSQLQRRLPLACSTLQTSSSPYLVVVGM